MKRNPIVSVGTIVIIGAIGILLLWLGVFGGTTMVVENRVDKIEVATSSEPAYPSEWLEEAEKAKAEVLRRKELEKENQELTAEIVNLEARQAEIEKELGF